MHSQLKELEALAWRLLMHDHADAQRNREYQCVELQRLIEYFERHGVPAFDFREGEFVQARVPPSQFGVEVRA